MPRSGFFYPSPSSLIFSICRYRVPIRYLAMTNIFLDNTAALRKKVPASKLYLNRFFFILLKQSIYFHMVLSYSAYAIATLAYHLPVMLHCDSRPLCTASWSVCEMQPTLATSISSIAFYIFLTLSHKMTWTCCLSISHMFSISSIACFTCSAVWLFAALVTLPVLLEWTCSTIWVLVFYMPYQMSSIRCSPARQSYYRFYMSQLDCFRCLI